jgi:hypothetical protein
LTDFAVFSVIGLRSLLADNGVQPLCTALPAEKACREPQWLAHQIGTPLPDHGGGGVRRIRLADPTRVKTQHLKMLDQWTRKNVQLLAQITRRARDKHHTGAVAMDIIPQSLNLSQFVAAQKRAK